jgi:hypothetical protein
MVDPNSVGLRILGLFFAGRLRIAGPDGEPVAIRRDSKTADVDGDGLRLRVVLLGVFRRFFRRRDEVRLLRFIDDRKHFEIVRHGFAAVQRQAEELRVVSALGQEQNRAAIRSPDPVVLATLIRGGRIGELMR